MNETIDPTCQQLLAYFFQKYPNPHLQIEVNRILKRFLALKIPMLGKPGGWAGGIIYALANQYRRPCGIPSLLNKEIEKFFNVSIETIYRRARRIRELLLIT
jgi:hypothetical protein